MRLTNNTLLLFVVVVADLRVIMEVKATAAPKPFRCTKCSKAFTQLKGLNRHKRFTHGAPVFLHCRHCGYVDKRRDNLRRHYKSQHPDKMSEVTEIRGKPLVEEAAHPAEGKTCEVETREVRRVITCVEEPKEIAISQEAESKLPNLQQLCWMPAPISPLCSSPSKEEDAKDDDAISIASLMPPLGARHRRRTNGRRALPCGS